jgi:hypothetical protein
MRRGKLHNSLPNSIAQPAQLGFSFQNLNTALVGGKLVAFATIPVCAWARSFMLAPFADGRQAVHSLRRSLMIVPWNIQGFCSSTRKKKRKDRLFAKLF